MLPHTIEPRPWMSECYEIRENFENIDGRLVAKEGQFWDDLRSPASGINPAGLISPPTLNQNDGSLSFAKGNAVCAWFQFPHGWAEGTPVVPHIHWSKATSAAGNVHWQIKTRWGNRAEVMSAFTALSDGSEVSPGNQNTADMQTLTAWPEIPGDGKTISSMMCVYLIRVNDGLDTYAGTANLYEIDIHALFDSIGSRLERVK